MRAVGADCFASQNIPTDRREGDERVLFHREYDCVALIFRAHIFVWDAGQIVTWSEITICGLVTDNDMERRSSIGCQLVFFFQVTHYSYGA